MSLPTIKDFRAFSFRSVYWKIVCNNIDGSFWDCTRIDMYTPPTNFFQMTSIAPWSHGYLQSFLNFVELRHFLCPRIEWSGAYCFYYTPVFRRDVLWYGDVRPTLRPSIRPSVRVSVRPFSALFSYMLWHIELKFCTWLCFNVLQIKFECRHFASIFEGVMPLCELRI